MTGVMENWQLAFNGLTIGHDTPFDVVNIEGAVDVPEIEAVDTPSFTGHGVNLATHKYGMRTITMEVEIWSDTPTELAENVAAFTHAFSPEAQEQQLVLKIPIWAPLPQSRPYYDVNPSFPAMAPLTPNATSTLRPYRGARRTVAQVRRRTMPLTLRTLHNVTTVHVELVCARPYWELVPEGTDHEVTQPGQMGPGAAPISSFPNGNQIGPGDLHGTFGVPPNTSLRAWRLCNDGLIEYGNRIVLTATETVVNPVLVNSGHGPVDLFEIDNPFWSVPESHTFPRIMTETVLPAGVSMVFDFWQRRVFMRYPDKQGREFPVRGIASSEWWLFQPGLTRIAVYERKSLSGDVPAPAATVTMDESDPARWGWWTTHATI